MGTIWDGYGYGGYDADDGYGYVYGYTVHGLSLTSQLIEGGGVLRVARRRL